ncbi:MAG TPA: hypothetical protein DCF68_12955 [Cyanothece sp. UBA12306]|nr:hypothetical protein [Cyanothece sp. UBA12306]
MFTPFLLKVNNFEICFHGMARSGNHAIIDWIISMYPEKVDFWNCVGNIKKKIIFRKKYVLIHSYENRSLADFSQSDLEKYHDLFFGKSQQRYDVLLIRDPFNLFASRLQQVKLQKLGESENKFYMGHPKYIYGASNPETYVSIWKEHAKEYLQKTSYLKHNKITISYNQWLINRAYREQIANCLNLKYKEDGLERVSGEGQRAGAGSSFDLFEYQGQANQMKTLERWKNMLGNPNYRSLFKDPEIWSLSEQIFSHIPGTETLCDLEEE